MFGYLHLIIKQHIIYFFTDIKVSSAILWSNLYLYIYVSEVVDCVAYNKDTKICCMSACTQVRMYVFTYARMYVYT